MTETWDSRFLESLGDLSLLQPRFFRRLRDYAAHRGSIDIPLTTYSPARWADDGDAVPVRTETIRYEPFQIAFTDLERYEADYLGSAIDGMRFMLERCSEMALNAAEPDHQLLDRIPTSIYRSEATMATLLTYHAAPAAPITGVTTDGRFATTLISTAGTALTAATYNVFVRGVYNSAAIQDIAVEGAYDVYGTGAGNVLGDYRVYSSNSGTSNDFVRIAYSWRGTNSALLDTTRAVENYRAQLDWVSSDIFGTPDPARAAKLEVARVRAEKLFLGNLSPEQQKRWAADGYVDVDAPSGRRYRIKNTRSANVYLIDRTGREVRKYCAYANDPGGCLPDGDHWYTQMLALKYDERAFLRAANTWAVEVFPHDYRAAERAAYPSDPLAGRWKFVGQGADAEFSDAEARVA